MLLTYPLKRSSLAGRATLDCVHMPLLYCVCMCVYARVFLCVEQHTRTHRNPIGEITHTIFGRGSPEFARCAFETGFIAIYCVRVCVYIWYVQRALYARVLGHFVWCGTERITLSSLIHQSHQTLEFYSCAHHTRNNAELPHRRARAEL